MDELFYNSVETINQRSEFHMPLRRSTQAFDQYLPFMAAVMQCGDASWKREWDEVEFVTACHVHGVAALIAYGSERCSLSAHIPMIVQEQLTQSLNTAKVFERLHKKQLDVMFTGFQGQSIPFIVLKGTAMAYEYYPKPYLRTRGDTDLIIPEESRKVVNDLMLGLGFEISMESNAQLNSYQRCYVKEDDLRFKHTIDVHWRISNSQLFGPSFSWQELFCSTAPIRGSGHNLEFMTLLPINQLLHACTHRAVHLHSKYSVSETDYSGDRLIWLNDIALISAKLTEREWRDLAALCHQKMTCTVVRNAVLASQLYYCFECPKWFLKEMQGVEGESSASLVYGSANWISVQLAEFRAITNSRDRVHLLWEKLFPSPTSTLTQYGKKTRLWLLVLYPWRWVKIVVDQFHLSRNR